MCQIVSTGVLHREMLEFFEEQEPHRSVNDHYVEQFEPWMSRGNELWSDDDLELITRRKRLSQLNFSAS